MLRSSEVLKFNLNRLTSVKTQERQTEFKGLFEEVKERVEEQELILCQERQKKQLTGELNQLGEVVSKEIRLREEADADISEALDLYK